MHPYLSRTVYPYLSAAVLVWAVTMTGVIVFVYHQFETTTADQQYYLSSSARDTHHAASSTSP